MTNEVVKKDEKVVANIEVDEFINESGAGMENVTAADLLVPRLTIIQALSPQKDRTAPEYIKGVQEGDICDVGLSEYWDEKRLPVVFLPVYYRKDYLEWAPRSTGKGLIEIHKNPSILQDCKLNEKRQYMRGENLIAETMQFFGLNLSVDTPRPTFIPFASTQIKKGRGWLTLAQNTYITREGKKYTAPLYYSVYNLSTVPEQNSEGKWFGWKITQGPKLPELEDWKEIKEIALRFRESLISGEARVDTSSFSEEKSGNAEEPM